MSTDLDPAARARLRIRVEGIVQGVGFRPFVYGLAGGYGLGGFVGNDARGVLVEAEGDGTALAGFVADLTARAPVLAVVERLATEPVPVLGEHRFRIAPSETGAGPDTLVSPDMATCAQCVAESRDPTARRYRYAFTNCTNCGPRFTIVTGVPYDRGATTMREFPMCPDCAREYADPGDRRFHAEPVCCPACGPVLRLLDAAGEAAPGDPVATAAAWLRDGRVLAVKGLGGYHLAALAGCEPAVAALRARKHREDKPFAVLAADLAAARTLVEVPAEAVPVLTGTRRPIVLLARRVDAPVAPSVAPGNRDLGVLLPYTPLHRLLAAAVAQPLVLTSGNVSDEPIAYQDADALSRLSRVADGFLLHDRRIHVRTDDSVVRVFAGRELPVRRSRGYAPAPLRMPWRFPRPVLACGAELKNTFCLGKGAHAFVSHHVGDLENYETLRAYREGVAHYRRLFDVRPEVVAYDLHPEYLSTKYAAECEGVELVGVQHHHAHIASCLADNGEPGPVLGVAFDGLGYGPDGTLWGGELLVADLASFERVGHLAQVPMPGGAAAVRQPWRMAAAYLDAVYGDAVPDLDVVRRHADRWAAVVAMARAGASAPAASVPGAFAPAAFAPATSSAGRLFDAVSAVIGLRDTVTYEGQAAVDLEQRVDPAEREGYPVPVDESAPLRGAGHALVRFVADDLAHGVDAGRIAARFHHGLARAVVDALVLLRDRTGVGTVALSGGVFQNLVLLDAVVSGLGRAGMRVLVHGRVPPNDGGISLGQAAVAAARDAGARGGRSADAR